MEYYGAIEAGGTKFVCAIGNEHGKIAQKATFPTTTPNETFAHIFDFFDQYSLQSIGVGSFGPIDIRPTSKTYGNITSTPKEGWRNFPFVQTLKKRYPVPIYFTTDVNAAAYGEKECGAARNCENVVYITVGTGIGAGIISSNQILEGYGHPEAGHVFIKRHIYDTYKGKCPYHQGSCLEGMASGPAIEERYGKPAVELSDVKEVWETEAYYLAQAILDYTLILRPEKIILGGGVSKQKQIFPMIREQFVTLLADYVDYPNLEEYIVPPDLGDEAGITGALLLAVYASKFLQ